MNTNLSHQICPHCRFLYCHHTDTANLAGHEPRRLHCPQCGYEWQDKRAEQIAERLAAMRQDG